jgi:hypothetical protein
MTEARRLEISLKRKKNPRLALRQSMVYTVRYEAVNAMLLNEFLKEHRKAQAQERKLEKQGATIAQQQKQIELFLLN